MIVGASNAVNLTDGLDGLAIGPSIIAAGTYMLFAYLTGNVKIANYLQIQYVPGRRGADDLLRRPGGGGARVSSGTTRTRRRCSWGTRVPFPWGGAGSGGGDGEAGTCPGAGRGDLRGGGPLGDLPGDLFYKTRKADLPDGADPPPLRAKGWAEPKIIVRFWIISIILALLAISTLKIR